MFFTHALVALVGFGSLVASAPAPANGLVSRRSIRARESKNNNSNNNNNKNNNNKNNNNNNGQVISIQENTIVIQQTIVQPQVTIIEENLGLVNQLALIAEQEFQALVQSQLALVQEIETIKNNIRVNTFLARFSQVNTVIVSVTQVIDLRNGEGARNTRYMVNQQLANNGKSQSTVVVMLSAASPVTINAAAPTLNLGGLLSNNTNGAAGVVSAAVAPSATAAAAAAVASAAASNSTASTGSASNSANIAGFDAANPFGQLGQTVILPYGSKAPSLPNGAQLVADPASIILAGQGNLIVEDINQFNQDCQLWNSNSLSLFNLQSSIIQEAAQIAALQVSGLSLGSAATLNSAAAALLAGAGSGANVGVNVGAGAVAATTSAAPVVVETTVAAAPAAVETTAAAAAAPPAVESAAAAAPPAEATTAAAAPAAASAAPVAAEPVAAAPVGFFTPTPAAPAAPAATEAAAVAVGAAVPSAAPEAAAPAASAAADTGSGVQFVPVAAA